MATHSSILAWEIPVHGSLRRIGLNWATKQQLETLRGLNMLEILCAEQDCVHLLVRIRERPSEGALQGRANTQKPKERVMKTCLGVRRRKKTRQRQGLLKQKMVRLR